MKSLKLLILPAALAVLVATAGSASAGSHSANLNLSMTVNPECNVQVADIAETVNGYTANASADIGVSLICNRGTAYELEVDNGQNFGMNANHAGLRALSNGTDYMAYQLWADNTRTTPWGSGANAITGIATGEFEELETNVQFHVDLAPSGVYSDAPVVTVNWTDV